MAEHTIMSRTMNVLPIKPHQKPTNVFYIFVGNLDANIFSVGYLFFTDNL